MPKVERRLAAIFAADLAGYSRLMEADELGTLRSLDARRALMDRLIAEHGGRIANTAGDSVLAEFSSITAAAECALEVQSALEKLNDGVPSERALRFRIGLHLGDILLRDGDLFGDGVNIAARLQVLAQPGGICMSGEAYAHLRKSLPVVFEGLGEKQLKNIEQPVSAYALSPSFQEAKTGSTSSFTLSEKPSIAILPFDNLSGDPAQDYFAEGMADDLINSLYRAKWLIVIARSSSFVYKGKSVDVKQVGRELGVRYALGGSVRRAGDRVRISVQLLDAASGAHVWSDRFEGRMAEIFEVQDRITVSVAGAVEPRIRLAEVERARAKPTERLDAYDLYLRALPLHYSNDRDQLVEAQSLLARAIQIDPTYTTAKAFSALTMVIQTNQGWTTWSEQGHGARLAREALKDNRDDPVVLRCAGHAVAYLAHDHDTAIAMLERAVCLHPNSAEVHHSAGWVWNFTCDGSRAREHFERALRLNPIDPEIGHTLMGITFSQLLTGNYEEALETALKAGVAMPTSISPPRAKIVALIELGRLAEARETAQGLLSLNPSFTVGAFRKVQPFRDRGFVERYMSALSESGIPE